MRKRVGFKWKEIHFRSLLKNFYKKNKRWIMFSAFVLLVVILLIPPFTYLYFARDLKDKDSIMNRGKTGLTLLTRDNKPFYTFYQPKEIKYIPLSDIPENVQEAVIATEDKNFYTNPGFSIRGIARAFLTNLFARRIVEGGSTITQELAKNAFLTQDRNFLRKYQEIVLAAELNRRFSKEDILEMYLNSVYFGEGAFGIENASLAYFGKPAHDLTLSESALLIGLLPAPSAYSPLSNDESRSLRRQQIVLNEMVEEEYITAAEKEAALSENLEYNPSLSTRDNSLAPHFAIYVKNQLIKKYGEERVIREGFQVQTTLDEDKQTYAQSVVRNQILALAGNNAGNGAAIAINPKNGEIEVMVGSYNFNDEAFGQTNMSVSPRQPGSSFKPIIYADAIERRTITAATILEDKPKTFQGNYKPQNYDKRFRGAVTVRQSLANSLNVPSVEIMDMVGVQRGLERAKNLGITTLGNDASKYGLSLVLGSGEVRLLELTNAFAVFANKGVYNTPKTTIQIKNKYGRTVDEKNWFLTLISPLFDVFNPSPDRKKVISEDVAFIISSILSDNRARSEVFGGSLTIGKTAAVKTGTTEDYRDALTVGYTPSLVVGVWVGNNDNTPMDNVAGSLGAAPIWRQLMTNYLAETPDEEFEKPTFVVSQRVCISSRLNYMEYFISGTQPNDSCAAPTPLVSLSPSPSISPSVSPTSGPTEEPSPTQQPTTAPPPNVIQPTDSVPLPTIQITGQ
jgi:1A family penicillin-binding protein